MQCLCFYTIWQVHLRSSSKLTSSDRKQGLQNIYVIWISRSCLWRPMRGLKSIATDSLSYNFFYWTRGSSYKVTVHGPSMVWNSIPDVAYEVLCKLCWQKLRWYRDMRTLRGLRNLFWHFNVTLRPRVWRLKGKWKVPNASLYFLQKWHCSQHTQLATEP